MPPNILFFQVDQMRADALSAYGNSFSRTPHLDALASAGVVFDNAYCNFPLCAPSRFSMATGQLCSAIGAFDNAAELPAATPTYAHYLRAAGYQTALAGKMHFVGPDQLHGFEARLTAEIYPADFSWTPNWGDEGARDTNDASSVTVAGPCARSVQIDYDEEVAAKAVQHLYDLARGAGGDARPFFLQVSFTHPHEPYLCLPEFWRLYDRVDIPPPTVGKLTVEKHDAHSIRLLKDFGMLDYEFTDAQVSRARRAYFGSVSYVDALIGRVLEALNATGMRDNTVIVFTADHGDMLGERGMWFKKHFFEASLRVPLLFTAPWLQPKRVSELASLVDLLPTFCGLTRGDGDGDGEWQADVESLAGDDLSPLLTRAGDAQESTRTVFAEYLAEAALAPIFMVRRGNYKYITSTADPALLFDVAADPHELRNLATDSAHAAVVAEMQDVAQDKWDSDALARAIIASQKHRRLIRESHRHGTPPRWDTDPATTRWYRGQGSYNEWAFDYLPVE